MARDAVVAIFDSRNEAYDAARDINNLRLTDADVRKGAIVMKSASGKVTTADSAGLGEAWAVPTGMILGGLIGALAGPLGAAGGAAVGGVVGGAGDLMELGLDEDCIDSVGARLTPGRSAIVAEVEEGSTRAVDDAVHRHGGVVFRRTLRGY